MEQTVPSAGEHFRMLIVVRQFGYRSATTFNRLFERLQRVQSLQGFRLYLYNLLKHMII